MAARSAGAGLLVLALSAVPACASNSNEDPDARLAEQRAVIVYGFAQLDFIRDFRRVDPDWEATLRPSTIPTTPGLYGPDGVSLLSIRQSRLGVTSAQPLGEYAATGQFEFDLFGVGANAGKTTFRLRQAWAAWGPVLIGQTNSLFMDADLSPHIIDYSGPLGMVFLRCPQIRLTLRDQDGVKFAVALERATNGIDAGNIRELDPTLGNNLRSRTPLPDLTAQLRLTESWGSFQLSGLLTKLAYDTADSPGNQPSGSAFGWGVNFGAALNAGHATVLRLGLAYGHGIASYMNDGGVDLAPETSASTPSGLAPRAIPLIGITAYVDHNWSKTLSSALGYSITRVWNTDFQTGAAFRSGQYASTNLLWTPRPRLMVGAELLWGKRTNNDGAQGEDIRTQFSARYSFTSGSLLRRRAG